MKEQKMKKIILAAIMVLVFTGVARSGGIYTAKELYKLCVADEDAVEKGLCMAYIAGVTDMTQVVAAGGWKKDSCLPEGVTLGQMADAFVIVPKIIFQKLGDKVAANLVSYVLADAWPCK
jgi:hypothetical protein